MYPIDYNRYRSVAGHNKRVRFLILHYTVFNFQESVEALTGPRVSAHYLVPDPTEASYLAAGFDDLRVFNLVSEEDRAWHAGLSSWAGRSNLNDSSIGIEIVNLATENAGVFTFPPFHPQQIDAVTMLAQNIVQRYPGIRPENVLAHSDISIGRRSDPGPAFPWAQLYRAGVGAWYDADDVRLYRRQFRHSLPCKSELLENFARYGYDVSQAEGETGWQQLIRAFQLHFRPEDYSGVLDIETAAILYALVKKYRS